MTAERRCRDPLTPGNVDRWVVGPFGRARTWPCGTSAGRIRAGLPALSPHAPSSGLLCSRPCAGTGAPGRSSVRRGREAAEAGSHDASDCATGRPAGAGSGARRHPRASSRGNRRLASTAVDPRRSFGSLSNSGVALSAHGARVAHPPFAKAAGLVARGAFATEGIKVVQVAAATRGRDWQRCNAGSRPAVICAVESALLTLGHRARRTPWRLAFSQDGTLARCHRDGVGRAAYS